MRNSREFSAENVKTILHHFEKAGDTLPLHSHGPGDAHFSFVARGRARAFGPGWERILERGGIDTRIVKFVPHQEHGFEALEDDTLLVNLVHG
jgi:hypothetical protein